MSRVALFLSGVFAVCCVACGGGGSSPPAAAVKSGPDPADPFPDDVFVLKSGRQNTPVCKGDETYESVWSAIKAGNDAVLAAHVGAGRVVPVGPETKVRVTDVNLSTAEVEVLGGEHAAFRGLVPRSALARTKEAEEADFIRRMGEPPASSKK